MYFHMYLLQLFVIATITILIAAETSPDWDTKVDKQLQEDLNAGNTVPVFLSFTSTSAILKETYQSYGHSSTGDEIADACWPELNFLRNQDQLSLQNTFRELTDYEVKFESLWLTNRLYVENCNLKLANLILSEAKKLVWMEGSTNFQLLQQTEFTKHEDKDEVTWGLQKIEMEKAWDLVGGAEKAGLGARVGIMDTGFEKNSDLINSNYNTHYGYFNPFTNGHRYPDDLSGHGTHITGTIVGKHGIGVAPGAEFISCVACDSKTGCPRINVERCGIFLFCPYAWDITIKGCGKIVDVIHIGFGTYEGGQNFTWFDSILQAWTVAKIIPVVAAGNGGGKCNSLSYPATLKGVLTVGSTNENDGVSEFTSFGPVEGNKYLKPDFVAPGSNIKSAGLPKESKYSVVSGSSSAAAHVTGLVAILKGKNKNLELRAIRKLISSNTDFLHAAGEEKCDGVADDVKPNFKYGHGRINAHKTIAALK